MSFYVNKLNIMWIKKEKKNIIWVDWSMWCYISIFDSINVACQMDKK